MSYELINILGLEYFCLLNGFDVEVFQNVTIKTQS